jgi:hypothetical protein
MLASYNLRALTFRGAVMGDEVEEWPEGRIEWLAYALLFAPSGFVMGIGAGIWIGYLIWG